MASGTVLGKSPQTINDFLNRLKQVKIANGQVDANGNTIVPNWQDYVPSTLSYQKPDDSGLLSLTSNEITNTDNQITQAALTRANNSQNQALFRQQKALERQAKKSYIQKLSNGQVKAAAKSNSVSGVKLAPPPTSGAPGAAPAPGREIQITSHGHTLTVNSSVASRFKGFLDDLWKQGYHFSSVSGYANRDIHTGPAAGKGIKSLHSIGYAIDIDPSRNPTSPIRSSGKYVYALPPSVGALAAKYGLSWGGNWHSYKDFMHVSVPYGGRE